MNLYGFTVVIGKTARLLRKIQNIRFTENRVNESDGKEHARLGEAQ